MHISGTLHTTGLVTGTYGLDRPLRMLRDAILPGDLPPMAPGATGFSSRQYV